MARRPDTFIIGAAKCGTTSLWDWLNGHPEVYMSPRKEPRYFAPDLTAGVEGKNLHYGRDLDRYLDLFAPARDEKRLGEATVRYMPSEQAPQLIRDFAERPFIIAMLRDPIEMMVSFHRHRVSRGGEPIADFEAALAAEESRRQGIGKGAELPGSQYRAWARFGEQLERWFAVFPRDRIHVMILEDVIANPAHEFRRVLEFLEVDPTYEPETYKPRNTRHEPRSRLLRRVLTSKPVQVVLWDALPRIVGERRQRRLFEPFSRTNRRKAEAQQISPQLRARLQDELAPDVELLGRLLERDMAALWWGERERSA